MTVNPELCSLAFSFVVKGTLSPKTAEIDHVTAVFKIRF